MELKYSSEMNFAGLSLALRREIGQILDAE